VFEAFQQKEFVVKEVKDNERSILKITHETAKRTMHWDVGAFVPFDEFYNNMFQQNLIHKGTRAINPTLNLDCVRKNPFAERVAKVLFMISNLGEKNLINFRPTLDNLTLLLMKSVDENKMPLRNQIEAVLQELIKHNMIREENGEFYFYNEDEAELSTMIKNTAIGFDARANIIRDILFPYIAVEAKFRFANNDFRITANIDGRNYFATPNPDVQVSFLMYEKTKAEDLILSSTPNTLSVCLAELFEQNKDLKEVLDWYCKVENYLTNNSGGVTESRKISLGNFRQRNKELFETKIKHALYDLFDKTRFVSGQTVIESAEITGKGKERYKKIVEKHFANLYKHAELTKGMPVTADELRQAANESYNPKAYDLKPMSEAEKVVNDYINRMGNEMLLSDLIRQFAKIPYGWKDVTVVYIVTELVKRRLREIKYKHQLRFPIKDFVAKSLVSSERSSLAITSTQEISQELINGAIASWAKIFNEHIPSYSDGNALFDELKNKLDKTQIAKWQTLKTESESYPFARPLAHLTDTLNNWSQIRDPKRFFETLTAEKDATAELIDTCRTIDDFIGSQLSDYKSIKAFYEANSHNFSELSEEDKSKATHIREFFESENPVAQFPIIKKEQKELKKAIDEALQSIKAQTIARYEDIFDQLEELAKKHDCDANIYADRTYKSAILNKEKNILRLRAYLSEADKFENGERQKIFNEVARKQAAKAGNSVAEPPVPYGIPRANKIIASKADVDEYVEEIRTELMKLIDKKKKIIIE
jgi:hypothetical protein